MALKIQKFNCWISKMRGEALRFKRCCFCLPLRSGLLGWGYLTLVSTIIDLLLSTELLLPKASSKAFHLLLLSTYVTKMGLLLFLNLLPHLFDCVSLLLLFSLEYDSPSLNSTSFKSYYLVSDVPMFI